MAVPAQSHRDEPVTRSVIDSTACAERVAAIAAALDCGPWYPRRREDRQWHRDPGLGHGGSFALFLENCAPAVNSLNFGITNPLLLGSANLQLAQIKAQLTLQQLNSVASTTLSNTALASLNQALVKINMSMFNARGPFGQNQGPPNQFGQSQVPASQFGQMQRPTTQFGQNQGSASQYAMNAPGTYMAGGAGAAGRGMGLGAQGTSPGNYSGMNMGMMNQSGNNVGLGQWPSYQSPSSGGYRPGYGSATTSSSQSGDQRSAVQLFHDTMKASNILANFGLSNEDLEELSRYPDEKLTPENMPYILREIRMRKMNKQQSSSSYSQPYKLQDKDYRREAVQSSVVDYGHGQQYDYRDRPVESPSMRYSRETLREGTWNEDFKRPSQNYQMESSRDESSHGIKRSVKKGLPKPKLMNDYYGVPALRFPHVCSLCNIECRQMRDWERHKKTSVHYDSCRLLLKEYPDWDPDAVPPTKDDLAKKEKEAVATDQAATSFSSSRMSPKHLSPRRMSPHRTSPRRSSPRKFSPRRSSPRKVSPRRMSPHRSRSSPRRTSPHRSRGSPRRTSPHRSRSSPRRSSPHRSRPRRMSPHKSRTSPKHSSPQRSSPRKSNTKRKTQKELPTKNSNQKSPNQKAVKRAVTGKPHAEAKSNTGHMDNRAATYQRQIPLQYRDRSKTNLHKDLAELRDLGLLRGTGLQSSESPAAGIRRRRWRRRKRKRRQASASEEAEYPDAQDKASAQQMNEMRKSGRVVHVTDLPHDGYTEEDISKLTQPFGKVVGIKLVSSKNEAFLEMAYKEAAVAVVEFYSITPAEINRRQVSMTLLGQKKDVPKLDQSEQLESQAAAFEEKENTADTSAVPQTTMEATTPSSADATVKEDETAATQKTESENASPNDKGRVIRISNLPAKGYTEEDLKRLAKPFGEVLNVVITFSKNQAYLEMACKKAATKMVEFYRLSTIKLEGNAISMEILHQYVDLSDMEVIFKDMVEESGFKPDDGRSIYDHLVHISNLPEDGYTEVDILWVAFRFGRVKASMFLKPHNKALLHLENANAAISMCSFFREIPHDFHGKTLEFSLSPHAGILPELDFTTNSPTGFRFDSRPVLQLRLDNPQRNALHGPNSEPSVEPSSGGGTQSVNKEPNPWWGRTRNSTQFMPLLRAKQTLKTASGVLEKSTFETILSGARAKWSSELLHWAGGPLKGSLDDSNSWKPLIHRDSTLECHNLLPLAFRLPLSLEHQNRLRFHTGIPDIPIVIAPEIDQSIFDLLVSKGVISTKQELDKLLGIIEATRCIQTRVTESISPLILAAQNFELDKLKGDLDSLSPHQLKEKLFSIISACRLAVVLTGQTHAFLSELRSDRLLRTTGMTKIAPGPLDFPNLSSADLLGPHFLDDLTCRMLAAKQKQHKPEAAKNLCSYISRPEKRKSPLTDVWPRFGTCGRKARR
ncbi:zinc finger protein 638-like isoform X9 [Hemitrygon akajei]|uniref:zinc finger protein 638-like isoform X9 n=1 Tax=Hemitrygon akajei TaxID=2704970 RepID=UPI003BF9B70C